MSKDNELMLDVGQANELKLAFRRNGWSNADVKKLCEGDMAAKILPVVREHGRVIVDQHIVDLGAHPFVPSGWKVMNHQKGGQLIWSPEKVKLYLSERQKGKEKFTGSMLQREFGMECEMNTNLLDYLLVYPELIPDSWQKGDNGWPLRICFWGTIYRDPGGACYIRYLYFDMNEWRWDSYWIGSDWLADRRAVLAVGE